NKDERLTRVTPEFCRRTIAEVKKLQAEFRKNLGVTFAFLGDEIYLKGGVEIPSKEHYGKYPQIEDGVGMIRSFTNEFEEFLEEIKEFSHRDLEKERVSNGKKEDVRTHELAIKPEIQNSKFKIQNSKFLKGTIMTGEMFAPVLDKYIEKLNNLIGSEFHVLAVPNTYFGGDVAVAGLLSGQDFLAVKDQVKGDFVIIPESVIKSDEPILIDGMQFDELKSNYNVPVYDVDVKDFVWEFLEQSQ
ncbi:MAG: DUF512 domain-containing protein, partial [Aridibacter sp.]